MDTVVRAYPLRPGMKDALTALLEELEGERKPAVSEFYTRHGVRHESWHLQRIGEADFLVVCTVVDDAKSRGAEFAASTEPFDVWFKEQVHRFTDFDPNLLPLGPEARQLFEWEAPPA